MIEERSNPVVHVRLRTDRSFEEVRAALEASVPKLDTSIFDELQSGDKETVARRRRDGPPLWIFEVRDHGALLAVDDRQEHCLQYEIGNPLTAELMTRETLPAGLYAPLRVVLYAQGAQTIAEYDKPSTLVAQLGNENATEVACVLDDEIRSALERAMGLEGFKASKREHLR